MNSARRQWLVGLSSVGAGAILLACNKTGSPESKETTDDEAAEPEVTATEDLMREHGILRRALLVYQETATKLNVQRCRCDNTVTENRQTISRLWRGVSRKET